MAMLRPRCLCLAVVLSAAVAGAPDGEATRCPDACAEDDDGEALKVSLLQTALRLGGLRRGGAPRAQGHVELAAVDLPEDLFSGGGPEALEDDDARAAASSLMQTGLEGSAVEAIRAAEGAVSCDGVDILGLPPVLTMQVQLETLRSVSAFPAREAPCRLST